MTVTVTVNGAPHSLPAGATVADLLQQLGLDRPGVAVAVDHRVVPRSRHPDHALAQGVSIEIIRAVGGG
ncbi:MAG: sulfur carrier protein [Myxococcota bacterium]